MWAGIFFPLARGGYPQQIRLGVQEALLSISPSRTFRAGYLAPDNLSVDAHSERYPGTLAFQPLDLVLPHGGSNYLRQNSERNGDIHDVLAMTRRGMRFAYAA